MQRRASLGLALVVCLGLGGLTASVRADDQAIPTGTWKWTFTFNDQTVEFTLKLKAEGDRLTGTLVGFGGQESPITDGKFKNGEVSFQVVRERDGQKFTVKYQGKVTGDTITGKSESDFGGQTRTRDWEAKRSK